LKRAPSFYDDPSPCEAVRDSQTLGSHSQASTPPFRRYILMKSEREGPPGQAAPSALTRDNGSGQISTVGASSARTAVRFCSGSVPGVTSQTIAYQPHCVPKRGTMIGATSYARCYGDEPDGIGTRSVHDHRTFHARSPTPNPSERLACLSVSTRDVDGISKFGGMKER
jgi:hypothetical protein